MMPKHQNSKFLIASPCVVGAVDHLASVIETADAFEKRSRAEADAQASAWYEMIETIRSGDAHFR
jgi:hypothetical protein